jgi:hypothetical protein
MPEPEPLTEEQILERISDWIVKKRMSTPALFLLESFRPMNFIGSQFVVFCQPFLSMLFDPAGIETFTATMERRENVERLLILIERKDREAMEVEREEKRARKEARRKRREEKRAARKAKREISQ